jgi:hypothetical protein
MWFHQFIFIPVETRDKRFFDYLSSLILYIVFLNFYTLKGCNMLSHCDIDVHFLDYHWYRVFLFVYWPFMFRFSGVPIPVYCLFVRVPYSLYVNSLCMLWMSLLVSKLSFSLCFRRLCRRDNDKCLIILGNNSESLTLSISLHLKSIVDLVYKG